MQQKIRINDLARELEVKSKAILDVLPQVGVTEKKTHSSSIEEDEAVRVRAHFQKQHSSGGVGENRRQSRDGNDLKPQLDLSPASKPGAIRAILERAKNPQAAPPAPPPRPTAPQPPIAARPATPAPPARPATPPIPAARTEAPVAEPQKPR